MSSLGTMAMDFAVCFIRAFLGLLLIRKVLGSEKKAGWTFLISFVTAGILTAMHAAGAENFIAMAAETAVLCLAIAVVWKLELRMGLFLLIFYEMGDALWCFLCTAAVGVLTGNAAFLTADSQASGAVVLAFHLILLCGGVFLLKKTELLEKRAFSAASFTAVAGIIGVVMLSAQSRVLIEDDALHMWETFALILAAGLLVYKMSRQFEMEKELAELKAGQAELLERDYQTLNRAYSINAKLFHDFHNHIGVLHSFLANGKNEKALEYLEALQGPSMELLESVWTGDDTTDYLINSKMNRARAGGIRMEVNVEFPRHTNIRNADLCAILGNLLDNALEAAEKHSKTEQKYVHLTIRRINQMLVIKVENSFYEELQQTDGVLLTTKEDKNLHGWGLKSARAAAEKYNGMVRTSCADHQFQAVVTLFFDCVESRT